MDPLRERRTAVLAEEIAVMRARLSLLAEELTDRSRQLEDSELRLLIAETPVADAQRYRAARGFRLVRHEVEALEARLAELERTHAIPGQTGGGSRS